MVHTVATTLALGAVEAIGVQEGMASAPKMFALGLLSWMYWRELEHSEAFIREKFARKPNAEANVLPSRPAGNYGENPPRPSARPMRYRPRPCRPASTGRSRAATRAGLLDRGGRSVCRPPVVLYPITPASDIPHER